MVFILAYTASEGILKVDGYKNAREPCPQGLQTTQSFQPVLLLNQFGLGGAALCAKHLGFDARL